MSEKVLHLTLEKKWFDMIRSGEKHQEYREIKPCWTKRIFKGQTHILFVNGYGADKPRFKIELNKISTGIGFLDWGAPFDETVYILDLGKIVDQAE